MKGPAVIDASVALKWFLIEDGSEAAADLLPAILGGQCIGLVPELFYHEVFAVMVRKHPDPAAWAGRGFAWLESLPLVRRPMDSVLTRIAERFCRMGLTGYDATYAALAEESGAPWLSFDQRAAAALGNPGWIVRPGSTDTFQD